MKTNEFPVAPQPQTPATDVLLALSKFNSAIEELRQSRPTPIHGFHSITKNGLRLQVKRCFQYLAD